MALPSSGALSFSAIAAEYGKSSSNFYMGQTAGINSALPTSQTATWAASEFHTAQYGPDGVAVNRGYFYYLGLDWYGYAYGSYGSVSTRNILEVSNRLTSISSASNGRSYFKASSYAGIYALIVNGTDKWASKQWDGTQYWWNERWWTSTGTVNIAYWYNQ